MFIFECRDDHGRWLAELCGQQDSSNAFETREEAERELPRLAAVLDVEESQLRVVEVSP